MEKVNLRPPVVVVVGHVDHGKTSLLDYIRKTKVAAREAGGITQSIGAFTFVSKSGHDITFIDTPGHALFTNMRKRGVVGADIALLVVAGDDGVAPQTKEALRLLQESNTPFIVVITKVDLATASVETVLGQLEKEGVLFEKRGGNTAWLPVSSKSGEGVDELLELIELTAEVSEMKGDNSLALEGFVLETVKDKRGMVVSVVIKSGSVKTGDEIFAGEKRCKVKGIFDAELKPVKEINSGYPGQVLGFEELPIVGAPISNKEIKNTENKEGKQDNKDAKVKIFVKTKAAGSLEAILANMPKEVQVVGSSVGDVNESDVFFAKAAHASIFLFEAKISGGVKRLADQEGVKIEIFSIVYDFIDRLNKIVESGIEVVLGKAQIVAEFPFDGKKIAGSKILSGTITKNSNCKLIRMEKEVGKIRIVSIRKQKEEVSTVSQGEECGILFSPQLDFKVGDVILSVAS